MKKITKANDRHELIDLDEKIIKKLLRQGFVLPHDTNYGLIILLRGKPGTGKSTLALQLIDRIESSSARRYYCTLEQSQKGLEYKLASMLAAKALQSALTPDFKNDCFKYDEKIAWAQLKERTIPGMRHRLHGLLQKAGAKSCLPLFNEPDPEQRKTNSVLHQQLSSLVEGHLKPKRICIVDGHSHKNDGGREGPIGSYRSRVLMASQILTDPIKEACEMDKERKRKDRSSLERSKLPIVVVDGLSLLSLGERGAIELQALMESMRTFFQIGILVYEPNDGESTSLDHQADMVIELTQREIDDPLAYLVHEFCIRKARYQDAALGRHQFKIRNSGIAAFPSLHFQVHHYNYMDMELKRSSDPSWSPYAQQEKRVEHFIDKSELRGSLLDLIFDPQPGESIVLLGPRNSFKTQICIDFLARGFWSCPKCEISASSSGPPQGPEPEAGLLVSLMSNAPEVQRGLICPWARHLSSRSDNECARCKGFLVRHARAFCQRPGCITPAEFFHYVLERIEVNEPTAGISKSVIKPLERILFWDLTQMDYRFPLFRADKMLLPALMDMFKKKKLKSLFMGAGNADNTPSASAMADYVAFCWRSSYGCYANGTQDKPAELPYKKAPRSSLMVYVDRASATSGKSGKALFCVSVDQDDRLMLPQNTTELKACRIDLQSESMKKKIATDFVEIERITRMQGVK